MKALEGGDGASHAGSVSDTSDVIMIKNRGFIDVFE
jgi:hypothetical protein